MKTINAYKMIEKAGSKIEKDPQYFNGLVARFGYYNIELTNQDGEIIAIKVTPAHEKVDAVSDYYPGTYFKSLTSAIEYVLPRKFDGNPRPADNLEALAQEKINQVAMMLIEKCPEIAKDNPKQIGAMAKKMVFDAMNAAADIVTSPAPSRYALMDD